MHPIVIICSGCYQNLELHVTYLSANICIFNKMYNPQFLFIVYSKKLCIPSLPTPRVTPQRQTHRSWLFSLRLQSPCCASAQSRSDAGEHRWTDEWISRARTLHPQVLRFISQPPRNSAQTSIWQTYVSFCRESECLTETRTQLNREPARHQREDMRHGNRLTNKTKQNKKNSLPETRRSQRHAGRTSGSREREQEKRGNIENKAEIQKHLFPESLIRLWICEIHLFYSNITRCLHAKMHSGS